MCNSYKIPKTGYDSWKNRIMKLVRDKLYNGKGRNKNCNKAAKLASNSNINSLSNISKLLKYYHDYFIITTVDKANSNYAFICKKFYVQVLFQKLGFDLETFTPVDNSTYVPY